MAVPWSRRFCRLQPTRIVVPRTLSRVRTAGEEPAIDPHVSCLIASAIRRLAIAPNRRSHPLRIVSQAAGEEMAKLGGNAFWEKDDE